MNHFLKCRHCLGSNIRDYLMRCDVLGKTKSGKLKIKVYGRMFWKDTDHITAIRYVDHDRVIEIEETEQMETK